MDRRAVRRSGRGGAHRATRASRTQPENRRDFTIKARLSHKSNNTVLAFAEHLRIVVRTVRIVIRIVEGNGPNDKRVS